MPHILDIIYQFYITKGLFMENLFENQDIININIGRLSKSFIFRLFYEFIIGRALPDAKKMV